MRPPIRRGQVIGKAVAADGKALLPPEIDRSQPKPGELEVAFEGDGAVPIRIPVNGVPEPVPPGQEQPTPGPKTDTNISIHCPNGVGPNQDGTWKDDFDTFTNDPNGTVGNQGIGGVWTVFADYAGDSTHKAGAVASCTFIEGNT